MENQYNVDSIVFKPKRPQFKNSAREELKRFRKDKEVRSQQKLTEVVLSQLSVRFIQGFRAHNPYQIDKNLPKFQVEKPDRMIKQRVIIDGKRAVMRVHESQKKQEVYEKVQKKPSKTKECILNSREIQQWQGGVRDYVNTLITPQLDNRLWDLLLKLKQFYLKKAQSKSSIKAKKRFVVGFKEVIRSVNNKQAKIVIVAPDLEPSPGPNGLDKLIVNLSNACKDNQVPLMYALSRKELGAVIKNPPVKISVVSITDISSVEREAQNLIEMSERNRKRYIDYFVMQLDYSINPSYFI